MRQYEFGSIVDSKEVEFPGLRFEAYNENDYEQFYTLPEALQKLGQDGWCMGGMVEDDTGRVVYMQREQT